MKIKWLGHACFFLETDQGTRVVIDPFDAATGYQPPVVEADLCLCSHQHHDHNAVDVLLGSPEVITTPGGHQFRDIKIKGLKSYHDRQRGQERGENIIYFLEADGMRVSHCGDLGTPMDAMMMADFGRVDLLMVPVGGKYTISAKDAWGLAQMVRPSIVVPMHYSTPHSLADVAPLDNFLACAGLSQAPVAVDQLDLPNQLPAKKMQVVCFNYPGC